MASGQLGCEPRAAKEGPVFPATQDPSDAQLLERFAEQHDEGAFEALMHRYGPMVLGVCRRMLDDPHDAEDAFQATFLVLVRKAGAIDRPALLGNWLYGVASRIALKAKANATRRHAHERQAGRMPKAKPALDVAWREVQTVLDEELSRLPSKYRAPLVLCYLEGRTNEDTARRLGRPIGSMSWLLARGRELLRKRLNRRGLTLTAGLLALLLWRDNSSAAPPAALTRATLKAATLTVAKDSAAGAVTSSVAALVTSALRGIALANLKWASAILLSLVSLGLGAGVVVHEVLARDAPKPKASLLPWEWHGSNPRICPSEPGRFHESKPGGTLPASAPKP